MLSNRLIANIEGVAALLRENGELVFQDPWKGCVLAMAVALCEQGHYKWDEFCDRLIAEIDFAERHQMALSYYERWLAAFERLLVEKGFLTKEEIETRTAQLAKSVSPPRPRSLR